MKMLKILAFLAGVIFEISTFLGAYSSICSKGMNLKFPVLDIWGNLFFSWPPYWMPKIGKKSSDFCHILALKYQPNCQNILNVNWFHFLILEGVQSDCMIFLSPFLDVTRMTMSTVFILTWLF